MGHNRDKDQDTWNMYERVGMHRGGMLYRNVEGGEWKDSSVTEVKGGYCSRIYCRYSIQL